MDPKQIGIGQPQLPGVGSLIGVKHHIKPEEHDRESKYAIDMAGDRHQCSEYGDMDKGLGKLAVIHGSDSGNEAQHGGHSRIRQAGLLSWRYGQAGSSRSSCLQARSDAGFAIDGPHHVTLAVFA